MAAVFAETDSLEVSEQTELIEPQQHAPRAKFRALFLSDLHLGKPQVCALRLVRLLRGVDADTIYLVGDIFDLHYLERRGAWPAPHSVIVRTLLDLAGSGTRIVYLTGNHDRLFRGHDNLTFGSVKISDRTIHQTATGERFLVIHGDQYDGIVGRARWLEATGDHINDASMVLGAWLDRMCRRVYSPGVPLSAFLRYSVKSFIRFLSRFKARVTVELGKENLQGIICGHVHHAERRTIRGFHYLNTGDWVESCTAVVEHHNGVLEVLDWSQIASLIRRAPVIQQRWGRA